MENKTNDNCHAVFNCRCNTLSEHYLTINDNNEQHALVSV